MKMFGTKAGRAEAMRRLGGPDVDAERKKNAMTGGDKSFSIAVVSAAVVIAWGIYQLTQYNIARAMHPPVDRSAIVVCMDSCARQCAEAGQ
jgi:predicted SpoU family rRNA methylase